MFLSGMTCGGMDPQFTFRQRNTLVEDDVQVVQQHPPHHPIKEQVAVIISFRHPRNE